MVKYLSTMLNMGVNQQYYRNFDECCTTLNCKVTLKNKDLWKKFHSLGTEMIITKSGRRMFPSLHVQVSDLSPSALYCVVLEMVPSSHNRFKYSSSNGWFPAGSEEAQSPQRIYIHPDSPARGDYWMSQPISFGRLKLTNTIAPPADQVVLSSMHKYQPRIIIAKASDPREIGWASTFSISFPETQFIAVTAYQNDKITKLKIDNNPFAKGFRETGQSKCKKKKIDTEDDAEIHKCKVAKLEPLSPLKVGEDIITHASSMSPQVTTQTKSSLPIYQNTEDRLSSSPPEHCQRFKPSICSYQTFNPYEHKNPFPYYYPIPAYPTSFWGNTVGPFYPQISRSSSYLHRNCFVNKEIINKPKKITDFSIRAITGCK